MMRLAVKQPMGLELQQVANYLTDSEGTCACSRVMKRLDAKLVLVATQPSQGMMIVAAYCLPCSNRINETLKGLRRGTYGGGTETAPIEPIKHP